MNSESNHCHAWWQALKLRSSAEAATGALRPPKVPIYIDTSTERGAGDIWGVPKLVNQSITE
jgi:hypothetical protein